MSITVVAALMVELNVECNHCGNFFDLLENELNEEGHITMQALPDGDNWSKAHDDFTADAECPHCNKKVMIDGIAW